MTLPREEHQQGPLARQFGELCGEQESPPDVFAFLDSAEVHDARAQAEVLLVDQAERIERGCLRPVEEYFARYPALADSEALSLELIANEYHHRVRHGEPVSVETFLDRFPRLKTHLSRILPAPRSTSSTGNTTIEIPLQSLFNRSGETIDLGTSPPSGQGPETIDVSPASLPVLNPDAGMAEPSSQPGNTVNWDFSEQGMSEAAGIGEDTNSDTSHETLRIDPKSLGEMMEKFDAGEVSGRQPTQAIDPNRQNQEHFPDTLFDEGAAYDKSRQLRQFGDYELLGEIARGGMGVVFKARQKKLKRIVALKMILAGQLAGSEEIRRFYAEAESAAALDHPHIVPIYEVGQYRGQHFFSMGYVEGESLADKVAEHPLAPREAAQMMKTIAEAVEYAHQQGVIHRDLKPANVLLDSHGQPKITDFGLAKQTKADAELTTTGQIMGTPSYMSPEQATGASSQVGPRSDVYALGAMLYCLLTGRPPFQAPTVLELLQQVKSQEPVSPKRLTPNLPVDLETVCLKCLAKEPNRRYGSAQELADDLDRFLKGIPVQARPVGQAERLWRWCKRYPVVAGLMAAVALSLMLGAGISTYYAIAANRRAKEALEQYVRAEENFARAERNFQKAQAAVDQFFVQVSENTLLNQPGMQPLQHELLNQALVYYQEFLKERGDDPELRDELAITHFRVGLITEAVESPQAAIPALEKAKTAQASLLKENPTDPARLKALGNTLTALARVIYLARDYQEAEELYQQALEVREQVVSRAQNDPEAHRELASAYMNLGLVERGRGQSAKDPTQQQAALEHALTLCTTAQELRRELLQRPNLSGETLRKIHRDLGQGAYNLGNIHLQMNHPELALENYLEATTQFEKALQLDPNDQRNTMQIAICYRQLALLAENPQQAWEASVKADSHLEPLVRANPHIDDYRKELVKLKIAMTDTARQLNRLREAKQAIQGAREQIEALVDESPDDARLLLNALVIYRTIAELAEGEESLSQVLPPLEKIQHLSQQLHQALGKTASDRLRGDVGIELLQLGLHLHKHGHGEPALQFSRDGASLIGQLVQAAPDNLDHHFNHQYALGQLAQFQVLGKHHAAAQKTYRELLAALGKLEKQLPPNPELAVERAKLQFEQAKTHKALAGISVALQDPAQTIQELNQAQRLLQSLISQFPKEQAVFQPELDQTVRMQTWVKSRPAIAEKPIVPSPKSRSLLGAP